MRPQERVVVDVERVPMRPRWMRERLVERVEVVPHRLDLACVDDLVAEPEVDVLDLAPKLRQGMETPAAELRARQSDVERCVQGDQLLPRERSVPSLESRLEALPHGVQRNPGLAVADVAKPDLQVA